MAYHTSLLQTVKQAERHTAVSKKLPQAHGVFVQYAKARWTVRTNAMTKYRPSCLFSLIRHCVTNKCNAVDYIFPSIVILVTNKRWIVKLSWPF